MFELIFTIIYLLSLLFQNNKHYFNKHLKNLKLLRSKMSLRAKVTRCFSDTHQIKK